MKLSRGILRPATPYERRMAQLGRMFPPPSSHPLHELLSTRATIPPDKDISFRLWLQELERKRPSFILSRLEGGTSFPISNILRHYFSEYASRLGTHGPHSFPSSFNVIESFLSFSHEFFLFDLRAEQDHLLRLHDYIDWYTSGAFPEDPKVLTEVATEGLIYSYTMVTPIEDFRIQTPDSELAVSGVALVRHATELSMIALCGEVPAIPSDHQIPEITREDLSVFGRQDLESDPEVSVADRYMEEIPGHSRVIALVRFDLESRRYFVRYLNHDIGISYLVATDDPTIFTTEASRMRRKEMFKQSSETLIRYDPLFALLVSLMYLPVFFVAARDRVNQTTFSTDLHARRTSTEVRKAIRHLGRNSLSFQRNVSCLGSTADTSFADERRIEPPELEFAASGYWRSMPPGAVGEDESGNPIVGKTWVQRTEAWTSQGIESFVMHREGNRVQGSNPGHLYIMRSGTHSLDVYKIGKTTRQPELRAKELTATTGVPTQFEILAQWRVGDVDSVEKEIHHRLRKYRVNRRREFFRAPLPKIIAEIGKVIS